MKEIINPKVFPLESQEQYEKLLKIFLRIKPEYKSCKGEISIQCFHDNIDKVVERIYTVYKVTVNQEKFVLKRTDKYENIIYDKFLQENHLPVPKMVGHGYINKEYWILLQYIEGNDLKKFNEDMAIKSADALSRTFNMYWIEKNFDENILDNRFQRYYKRIMKRSNSLKEHSKLGRAYEIFLKRQLTCPRTLCNGDFMQVNGINSEDGVIIVDWAFGGIMPYSLDAARLITHGSEEDNPLYMTDELRKLFLERLYEKLNKTQLTYEQYLWDIKLSMLNECIEFIEYNLNNPNAEKDESYDYYVSTANKLADEILREEK